MNRNGKIKLDRLKKGEIESPTHPKGGKLTIIEVDSRSSPEKTNKTKIAAAIHMQRNLNNAAAAAEDKKNQI